MVMNKQTDVLDDLITLARSLGATAAAVLPAESLVIEDRFAALCAGPTRCPSYGLAPGCPPHAIPPAVFRRHLRDYCHVVAFKIDVPAEVLMDERRLPIARDIHRIAATLERTALSRGMRRAQGLAAGSCKELFCAQDEACMVLSRRQPCRHPDLARPSLSAMGVDFMALAASAGWDCKPIDPRQTAIDQTVMGLLAGLVLLA